MARVWRSAAERAALIDQWRKSGLSLPAFCARRGVNAKTMSGWIHKPAYRAAIDRARSEVIAAQVPVQATPAFLPVRVADVPTRNRSPARAGVAVVIGSSRRIVVTPGFDEETLRRVVAVLEDRSC
ncbi:MAG: hypothetical protein AB7I30_01435 [Isosphaeraceae bacterium]